MANLFTLGFGKLSDLVGKLTDAGFTAEMAEEVRKNPALARVVVDTVRKSGSMTYQFVHGIFTKPTVQIEKVRAWNKEFGWGISDEAFAEAEKTVPEWPEGKLVAVVLVPYFPNKSDEFGTITAGVHRTFHELWLCARSEQVVGSRWSGYEHADSNTLRLLDGIDHPAANSESPILRWEIIDLGYNRNKESMNICSLEKSPHAGILAAAMLHSEWVKSMDGDKIPFIWIPGYEVKVDGSWESVPHLRFDCEDQKIGLSCGWRGHRDSVWAVPLLVQA